MDRAYSLLTIKSVDDTRRIIRGTATTPSTDRMGDVVEPLGIKFKNPAPLLWQHQADKPVGLVKFDKPTKDGMGFEAELPTIDEPGALKDRVDEAWQSVKAGLVAAVSIGFRALKDGAEFMEGGGIRWTKSEVLELSLVTIPANAQATITQIKSLDESVLAASGHQPGSVGHLKTPGASGSITPIPKGITVRTTAEQITAFEAKRAASVARMGDIMTKASESNSTLEQTESEEYEGLDREVKAVDEHLVRLKKHEALMVSKAMEVTPGNTATAAAAGEVRGGVITSAKSNLPKGTAFARYVKTLASARGNLMQAAEMARKYDDSTPEVSLVLRAAVAAGTTTDTTWASPLVPYKQMTDEFIALLRPMTILGKFGLNGVPNFRQVPFNIKMPTQTGGSTVGWVGQTQAKPVSALAFSNLTLDFTKTAGIVVISEELARLSTPSADAIITQDLTEQTAQFLDQSFINPALTAVPGVSPASITNGATTITASGTDADAVRHDLRRLFAAFQVVNLSTAGSVWIMTETQATALSMMVNSLGQREFPNIEAAGGTLFGLPVVTSENVTQTTAGSPPVTTAPIVLVKASEILMADDGQVTIDTSREASLQMDSAPTNPPVAATVMVSLWQMNLIGIRAERWINWVRRRTGSVAYISNANYGT